MIIKLSNKGWSNKKIITFLELIEIKTRNMIGNYTIKYIWVCIVKIKKRVDTLKNVKYSLEIGFWI